MAADILLCPDLIPVGEDQKQHWSMIDTDEKFDKIFGETFKLTKEIL